MWRLWEKSVCSCSRATQPTRCEHSLALDTGHVRYDGDNNAEILRTLSRRVWHVHFKKCDARVLGCSLATVSTGTSCRAVAVQPSRWMGQQLRAVAQGSGAVRRGMWEYTHGQGGGHPRGRRCACSVPSSWHAAVPVRISLEGQSSVERS